MSNGLYNGLIQGYANGMYAEPNPIRVSSELGTIFTDSFSRASLGGNYSVSGAASFTTDGVKLTTSGGSGTYTTYMERVTNTTCLERHSHIIDFKMTVAPGSTTYGLGVGVLGKNTDDSRSYTLRIATVSGASLGKTLLDTAQGANPNWTNRKTSTSGMTISSGDNLRMIITRDFNVIKWTVINLTTGSTYDDSFTFSYSVENPTHVPHAGGRFFMSSFGGTFEITNWTVSSKEIKNPKCLFIGDSITYGIFSDALTNRWANKLMGETPNYYVVSGGASDKTSEVLGRIDELILINPKYAVLMIGGNDLFFSVPDATTKANYLEITSRLKAAGITVVHCFATPRTSLDLRNWNSYLLSKYSSTDTVIQKTFNLLTTNPGSSYDLKADCDSGDGVHPNKLGHYVLGNAIFNEVPYIR